MDEWINDRILGLILTISYCRRSIGLLLVVCSPRACVCVRVVDQGLSFFFNFTILYFFSNENAAAAIVNRNDDFAGLDWNEQQQQQKYEPNQWSDVT